MGCFGSKVKIAPVKLEDEEILLKKLKSQRSLRNVNGEYESVSDVEFEETEEVQEEVYKAKEKPPIPVMTLNLFENECKVEIQGTDLHFEFDEDSGIPSIIREFQIEMIDGDAKDEEFAEEARCQVDEFIEYLKFEEGKLYWEDRKLEDNNGVGEEDKNKDSNNNKDNNNDNNIENEDSETEYEEDEYDESESEPGDEDEIEEDQLNEKNDVDGDYNKNSDDESGNNDNSESVVDDGEEKSKTTEDAPTKKRRKKKRRKKKKPLKKATEASICELWQGVVSLERIFKIDEFDKEAYLLKENTSKRVLMICMIQAHLNDGKLYASCNPVGISQLIDSDPVLHELGGKVLKQFTKLNVFNSTKASDVARQQAILLSGRIALECFPDSDNKDGKLIWKEKIIVRPALDLSSLSKSKNGIIEDNEGIEEVLVRQILDLKLIDTPNKKRCGVAITRRTNSSSETASIQVHDFDERVAFVELPATHPLVLNASNLPDRLLRSVFSECIVIGVHEHQLELYVKLG
eukprot:TRINITY_DN1580_c0_g4_i1.p1 TRINITY_DN1580_c0_g4~~TRINITY_DN1580_c0_g4_i1.p1  ORF type:complete len:518 (-),score=154.09 TRINITY_DN1580_c0_g4_i1:118-1671(-)